MGETWYWGDIVLGDMWYLVLGKVIAWGVI